MQILKPSFLFSFAYIIFFISVGINAETFFLKNGRIIKGKVIKHQSQSIEIQTEDGETIFIDPKSLKRVIYSAELEAKELEAERQKQLAKIERLEKEKKEQEAKKRKEIEKAKRLAEEKIRKTEQKKKIQFRERMLVEQKLANEAKISQDAEQLKAEEEKRKENEEAENKQKEELTKTEEKKASEEQNKSNEEIKVAEKKDQKEVPTERAKEKLNRDLLFRSAILPGWGLVSAEKKKEGYITGGLFFGSLLIALKERKDYLDANENYKTSVKNSLFFSAATKSVLPGLLATKERYNEYRDHTKSYNAWLFLTGMVYVGQLVWTHFVGKEYSPAATSLNSERNGIELNVFPVFRNPQSGNGQTGVQAIVQYKYLF
ncbi:MAG: hypothetical protein K8R21_02845 [Leptospira sp.]|nr:hypothetical protein [Leptospira sp.]